MSETNSLELIDKLSQDNIDQYCSKEDIELMVLHTLEINKNTLYRESPSLDDNELKKIAHFIERRNLGEPLAYYLGIKDFGTLIFLSMKMFWFQGLRLNY